MEIIVLIFTKMIIEWTTVSVTSPVRPQSGQGWISAVYYVDTCNQVGTDYEVTMGHFTWQGKERTFEIARKQVESATVATRAVPCDESVRQLMSK